MRNQYITCFFENNLSGQNFVLHKKICWHAMFLSQMLLTGMVKHNTLLNILRKHSCQLVKVEKSCTIAAAKFSFRFAMWRRIICWRSKKCWSVHFLYSMTCTVYLFSKNTLIYRRLWWTVKKNENWIKIFISTSQWRNANLEGFTREQWDRTCIRGEREKKCKIVLLMETDMMIFGRLSL